MQKNNAATHIKKIKYIMIVLSIMIFLMPAIALAESAPYTVKGGDTLYGIARHNGITVNDLLKANPGMNLKTPLKTGTKINVPTAGAKAPATSVNASTFEKQVVDLVNKERTSRGLVPLTQNDAIGKAARAKSTDMRDKGYFSHTSPTYGSPFEMLTKFGVKYRAAGENIAKGQKTPSEVVAGWMNSPGHRANILNPSFSQIGVGYASDKNGVPYWTQLFTTP